MLLVREGYCQFGNSDTKDNRACNLDGRKISNHFSL